MEPLKAVRLRFPIATAGVTATGPMLPRARLLLLTKVTFPPPHYEFDKVTNRLFPLLARLIPAPEVSVRLVFPATLIAFPVPNA